MKVKDLKEAINELPDNYEVYVDSEPFDERDLEINKEHGYINFYSYNIRSNSINLTIEERINLGI